MRIFKTRWFVRYARQERIVESSLREAVERAENGLVDADLGGHIIKQRVARPGRGRSGGYRVIIALRHEDRAILLYGFAKNDRENIEESQLNTLRNIAVDWLAMTDAKIEQAVLEGRLQEI